MAYQTLTVAADWPAAPHYTADGETDVEIINPGTVLMTFIVTADDDVPELAAGDGSPILNGLARGLQLRDGERLWVACPLIEGDGTKRATLHY